MFTQVSAFTNGNKEQCAFVYNPFDTTLRQLRLLRVRGPRNEQQRWKQKNYVCDSKDKQEFLEYELCTFNSDEVPPYRALSYVWGEPFPSHKIHINRSVFFIRQNLYNFLLSYEEPGWIWIDQICINQQDLCERSQQVGKMSQIYERCESLIMWLGSNSSEFQKAVDGYHDNLCEHARERTTDRADHSRKHRVAERRSDRDRKLRSSDLRNPRGQTLAYTRYAELERHRERRLLAALLSDEYFTRLWIVQEVILPKEIQVLYRGTTKLQCKDWQSLARINFEKQRVEGQLLAQGPSEVLLQFQETSQDWWTLARCLRSFSDCCCFEPRDRVYALLGLVKEEDRIPIDYTKPVHEVFLDTVKALHRRHIDIRKGGEPCPRILLKLASNMNLDTKGKGALCFWRFLSNLFECPAKAVRDIGVDLSVSEISGSETVNAWWYETVVRKVVYTCHARPSEDPSTA